MQTENNQYSDSKKKSSAQKAKRRNSSRLPDEDEFKLDFEDEEIDAIKMYELLLKQQKDLDVDYDANVLPNNQIILSPGKQITFRCNNNEDKKIE